MASFNAGDVPNVQLRVTSGGAVRRDGTRRHGCRDASGIVDMRASRAAGRQAAAHNNGKSIWRSIGALRWSVGRCYNGNAADLRPPGSAGMPSGAR